MVGKDIELLEANLLHAQSLGVDTILLTVHDQDLGEVTRIADKYDAIIADIHTGKDIGSMERYRRTTDAHCQHDDWVMVADLDEFYEFPLDVRDIIKICDAGGFDYIQGEFLDRVGQGGKLHSLTAQSLWDRFPIGAKLTRYICRGNFNKVTLSRAWVELGEGHHQALNGNPCPINTLDSVVHHFKWDASFFERAETRIELLHSMGVGYWDEFTRVLEHLERNGQCFNLGKPELEAYWPSFRRNIEKRPTINPVKAGGLDYDVAGMVFRIKELVMIKQLGGNRFRADDPSTGASVSLNQMAIDLLDTIDGKTSVQGICNRLVASNYNSRREIEHSTQNFFRQMLHLGIVELT